MTDRSQTGEYKTNREKRWEALPGSPQFALRRHCLEIEHKLTSQVVHFKEYPAEEFRDLKESGLIRHEETRCPITLDPFSFREFALEVVIPDHGKSSFHVGHLNPLKAGSGSGRHRAENISWISEDGNRIQGNLALEEVQELLKRVLANYKDAGLL